MRPVPYVGMRVQITYLASTEEGVVEEVRDEGRTLVVGGVAYTLRRLTAHYVREGEPYYGVRLRLLGPE